MIGYKIVVAYDGTEYHGWQRQEGYPTITGVLEQTFKRAFDHEVTIIGASRTDAGVHAMGQVARFFIPFAIEPQRMQHAWNNILPTSILIRSTEEIEGVFHPQDGVLQKTYFYHFFVERPLPFVARYGWYYRDELDIEKLKKGLAIFIGKHDFRSFCTLEDDKEKDTVRTIDSIELKYLARIRAYRIIVRGHSFLHYMIRRIVGACIEVASRTDLNIQVLQEALDKRDPQQTLPKAPAEGLMLRKIEYKKGES